VSDRVVAVRAESVVLPLPEPLQLGAMTIDSREYATVRLVTEAGLTGRSYCLTRNAPVAELVDRLVAPHLVGRDSEAIGEAWEACVHANVMIGRTGLVRRALGLVDVALWDIAAQRARQPLHRCLRRPNAPLRAAGVPVMVVAAYPRSSPTRFLATRATATGS
jgi:L-alanine-DL-glutamate epimerase-like enolase superfamily enzyme